ncbi:MAG: ABC transporter permease [Vicinamibacteria bacterium]
MSGSWQDLRYAFRRVLKTPGFSAVVILVIGLGIGANSAMFSVVDGVLLRPLAYREPDRLVMVWQTLPKQGWGQVPFSEADFRDLTLSTHSFESVSGVFLDRSERNLSGGDEPSRVRGIAVSPDLFAMLGRRPDLGRPFLPEEAKTGKDRVAILSHRLWRDRFGADPAIVGKPIVLDGDAFSVVGVMPSGFVFPPPMANPAGRLPSDADLWLPLAMGDAPNRDYHPLAVVARLAPEATLAEARREVATLAQRLEHEYPKTNTDAGMAVVPMHEQMVWNVRPALLLLMGAVGFVLLIACANVAHLLLARTTARQHEMAIRAALGASRRRAVQQVLVEGLLFAVAGGGLGILLAHWGVDLLRASEVSGLPRLSDVAIDVRVLAFTGALAMATGLLFALAPALQATRQDPDEALRRGGRASTLAFGRFRGALVVGEVALALVLLAGAGLLLKSLGRLIEVDPGFDSRNLLTMGIDLPEHRYPGDAERAAFFQRLVASVETLGGVKACGLVNSLPIAGWQGPTLAYAEGKPIPASVADTPLVGYRIVSPGFFATLGMAIRRGRLLSEGDDGDARHVAVLNETAVRRLFGNDDPIGRQLHLDKPDSPAWTIVGVTSDTRHEGLAAPMSAEVYLPLAQEVWSRMNLVVRTTIPPNSLAAAVQQQVRALDREQPVHDVKTMDDLIADSVAPARFQAMLLGGFAALALTLAAIGLYGVVSYSVGQRTREIAIRISQGAPPDAIFRMVVGQGMALTAAGILLGLIGAVALSRVLGVLLFDVSAVDPPTLVAVSGILGAVALVANFLPARRAESIDPVEALRAE